MERSDDANASPGYHMMIVDMMMKASDNGYNHGAVSIPRQDAMKIKYFMASGPDDQCDSMPEHLEDVDPVENACMGVIKRITENIPIIFCLN